MSITITDDTMTTDQVNVSAWLEPDAGYGYGRWAVSWLPGRLLDRNQAITALSLAEHVASGQRDGDGWTLLLGTWAAELGLTGDEVLERLTPLLEPSGTGGRGGTSGG